MDSYKEVYKKVKILKGETQEEIIRQLEKFKKTHSIIETKQYNSKIMFVFYLE
jgi:hypothetical protein